jgi:hypothetical protein
LSAEIGRIGCNLAEQGFWEKAARNQCVGAKDLGESGKSNRRVLSATTLCEECCSQRSQHGRRHAIGAKPDSAPLVSGLFRIQAADAVVGVGLGAMDQH